MTDDINPRALIGGNNPPIEDMLTGTQADLLARIAPIADRATKAADDMRPAKGKPPVITSDEQLGNVAAVAVDAKSLFGDLEAARKKEKQPYWDAGQAVDAFFKEHKDRMSRITDVFETLASDYQRAKIARERAEAAERERKAEAAAQKLRDEAEAAARPATAARKIDQAEQLERVADQAASDGAASNATLGKVTSSTGASASARTVWKATITDYDQIDMKKLAPYLARAEVEKALRAFVKIHKGSAKMDGVVFEEDVRASFRK